MTLARARDSIPIPDEEDLDALLVAADRLMRTGRSAGTDLVLMLLLGLDGGLRLGDVAGLRWCDVDIAKKTIKTKANEGR